MSLATTPYEHIVLDENGIPLVDGTNLKVTELIVEQSAHGWSPEELHFQHPYLSLGQIHSALAYYWDHRDELDHNIETRLELVNQMRSQTDLPPLVGRLREKGLLWVALALYMDHHVPRAITVGLRLRQVDVLTAYEDWMSDADDSALLDRAGDLGRVLFTHDDDLLVEAARRRSEGLLFGGVVFAHQL